MSVSLGGGGRRGSRRSFRPMAEINVTPMVDVMLVLLVIFMVTAPLLSAGVPVELPKSKAGALKGDDQPLTISIDQQGRVFVQDTEVAIDDLAAKLKAVTAAKPDTRIFVRGDSGINYGRIREVMGQLSAAGFPHVALLTQPAPPGKGAR
jgi:biopolymer transport protein TolR